VIHANDPPVLLKLIGGIGICNQSGLGNHIAYLSGEHIPGTTTRVTVSSIGPVYRKKFKTNTV
jgi:hypothetical protein